MPEEATGIACGVSIYTRMYIIIYRLALTPTYSDVCTKNKTEPISQPVLLHMPAGGVPPCSSDRSQTFAAANSLLLMQMAIPPQTPPSSSSSLPERCRRRAFLDLLVCHRSWCPRRSRRGRHCCAHLPGRLLLLCLLLYLPRCQ